MYKDIEKRKAYSKMYREKNKEKIKDYYKKNKEKLSHYQKNWRFKKFGEKTRERSNKLFPSMVQPSFSLGYVLGSLLGDGSIFRSGFIGRCSISVTDKDFSDFFIEQLKKIYLYHIGYKVVQPHGLSKKVQYSVSINSQEYTDFFNSFNYDKILSMPFEFKTGVLKGLFDSEGYVTLLNKNDKKRITRQIGFCQVRGWILDLVCELLKQIDINYFMSYTKNSGFVKNDYEKYGQIHIHGLRNFTLFKKNIGFIIKRKSDKLDLVINSFITDVTCIKCGKKFKIKNLKFSWQKICDNCIGEHKRIYQMVYQRDRYRRLHSVNQEDYRV